ncbi:pyrimidine operon regulatory protein/uracil phosphoribosyltransferase PyrR [Winkia neuii]|uniref:bifunctional pyr operon transcriptional regulator/uracil phosphoribosyltransferase PyrR n=1 Tax=Winkia neuii TaxID=33007 RepID=UPI000763F99A|nr:bifunctional pyr operon transcriptional regulator/uracil phosphoribosyltransferase PyrR [Winkia neuii]KWZ72098.1 pyrimidine operon regulatory protein/uracil phosphoribosyltransferase PyrR [Winkia neuii]
MAHATLGAKRVLSPDDISRSLKRISYEILERNQDASEIVLLGIPTGGVPLAKRIYEVLKHEQANVSLGIIDTTMYRDDLSRNPVRNPHPTSIPAGGLDSKTVVLVDDVLYSGRTIRAALDALVDIGRPAVVRLAVLVDRGHRELPIRADYVGKNLPSSKEESIVVLTREVDGEDAVLIEKDK